MYRYWPKNKKIASRLVSKNVVRATLKIYRPAMASNQPRDMIKSYDDLKTEIDFMQRQTVLEKRK